MNLRTIRTITYTAPPTTAQRAAMDSSTEQPARKKRGEGEDLGTITQLRATVATHSALARHRYFFYLRQIDDMIQQISGQPWEQARETQEGIDLYLMGLQWAIAISSLTRLEQRQISPTDDGAPWAEIDLPDAWKTPAGYLDAVAMDLASALTAAAREVNPGLLVGADEEAGQDVKKTGGVIVS
jgi:hypothetical protein